MNKQEFIDRLRAALNGNVSPTLVMENVNYYEDYINTEIRKGRTEEAVLQSLGDPRLIAKTIIETNTQDGQADYRETGYQGSAYGGNHGGAEGYPKEHERRFHLPGWLVAVFVIFVFFVILSAVLSVLSFLAPAIIAFAVVVFFVKLFRDWLN